MRKSERMDLDEVHIVGRVSRTSKISVHLVAARVAHGGVFAQLSGVLELTHRQTSQPLLDGI
ncbi:MAG: hypothetical protein QOH85_631 [Acidobacteriaceae bacterium]|jgi:hypothetical protein|nr:hypothetical protein [Acidobacteriaceae bacterium]